jgi:hypothetical protein
VELGLTVVELEVALSESQLAATQLDVVVMELIPGVVEQLLLRLVELGLSVIDLDLLVGELVLVFDPVHILAFRLFPVRFGLGVP